MYHVLNTVDKEQNGCRMFRTCYEYLVGTFPRKRIKLSYLRMEQQKNLVIILHIKFALSSITCL